MTIFHDYFSSLSLPLCVCLFFLFFALNPIDSEVNVIGFGVNLSSCLGYFRCAMKINRKADYYTRIKKNQIDRINKAIKMPTKFDCCLKRYYSVNIVLFFVNSFYNLVLIYNTNANSQRISYTIDYISLAWCFYFNVQSLSILR